MDEDRALASVTFEALEFGHDERSDESRRLGVLAKRGRLLRG